MAIPSSGAISLTTVQTEFGGSNPIGINEYYAGGAYVPAGTTGTNGAVPTSGQIALSNFYGTANIIPYFLAFRANANYENFYNIVNQNSLSSGPYSTYKNGFFYILGWHTNNTIRTLNKYSSSGVLQWAKDLGNVSGQGAPWAAAIQVDSSDNVYFASSQNGSPNCALIKFDSSGTYVWGYVYSLALTGVPTTNINLHIDNANNIYYSASQSSFASVTRITTGGTVGFCRTLSADAGSPFITSMTSSNDSSLLYIGCNNGKLIALETTNGQNIISSQLTQSGSALTVPVTIVRSGTSNNIYALSTDFKLFKLNSNFVVQWTRQLASVSTSYGYPSIATNSTDGSVIAAFGVTQYPSSYIWSTQLYKYDTNGNLLFAREANPGVHYGGPTMFASMTTDNSSSLYFFGGYSAYTANYVRPHPAGWGGRLPLDGTGTGAYLTPLNGIQNTTVYYGNSPFSASTITGGNTTFTNVSTTATSTATSGFTITATTSAYPFTTQSVSGTLTGGSAMFTQPGTYTWIAPAGVTSVSAVAVGGGAGGAGYSISNGGGGGGLAYANNITVTPGSSYSVGVGVGGGQGLVGSYGGSGGNSFFSSSVYANGGQSAGSGGTVSAGSGFRGGNGGGFVGGGGGAGGYTGIGGAGGGLNQGGGNGAGGAGGAGGGGAGSGGQIYEGGNAGAVGLGQAGQNGTGGPPGFPYAGYPGSSGGPWDTSFGGGGGAGGIETYCGYPYYGAGKAGGPGGVRIIWPGNTRSFPSTNTLVP